MKKIISIFAIVFALTLVMSVSVFAEGFTAGTTDGATVTGAEDRLTLSLPTVEGAEYTVLLVAGSGLPTVGDGVETFAETGISYINQYTGDGTTMEIEVLPLMGAVADTENTDYDGTNTLYIGSNAEGFELISVPVTYAEAVANDYITSEDTEKATVNADKASVINATMGDAVGNAIVSVALDATAYPAAGAATAGYILKVVNADGTDVTDAVVYYSAERTKYVALVPTTTTDYKFEVLAADTEGATANAVIAKYGNMNEDAAGVINAADLLTFRQIVKKTRVPSKKQALIADVSGDAVVNASDLLQFRKAVKKQTYNFAILNK